MAAFIDETYPIESNIALSESTLQLSDLRSNDHFVIKRVKMIGEIGKRMVEMGLNRGTKGKVIRKAPLGGPIEIRIIGYNLSLRKSEAEQITVEILHDPKA